MPSVVEFLGVAPWVIITAVVSWFVSIYANREKKKTTKIEQDDRLEIHRDELTLAIVRLGRDEIASAKIEVEDLRNEARRLRSMENHFFHFQQSLEHLDALLSAATVEERTLAEKNARAFLNRMRRLQEAKGTVANEAQRIVSQVRENDHHLVEQERLDAAEQKLWENKND